MFGLLPIEFCQKLPTDWDSFQELWEDVTKFMKEHPNHEIITADNPRAERCGWVAYLINYGIGPLEDEQMKEWTIPLHLIKPSEVTKDMFTNEGRLNMCRALNSKTEK
jgi:hypothetical protein